MESWRRGPAGPAAPLTGDREVRLSKERREAWPPGSSTIRPAGSGRISTGRIRVLLQEQDGLHRPIRRRRSAGEKEGCSKPWAGRPAARLPSWISVGRAGAPAPGGGEAILAGRTAERPCPPRAGQPGQRRGWGTWDMLGRPDYHYGQARAPTTPGRASAGPAVPIPLPHRAGRRAGHGDSPGTDRGVRHLLPLLLRRFLQWYIQSRINDAQRDGGGFRRVCVNPPAMDGSGWGQKNGLKAGGAGKPAPPGQRSGLRTGQVRSAVGEI